MTWTTYQIREGKREKRLGDLLCAGVAGKEEVAVLDYGCGTGVRTERMVHYLGQRRIYLHLYDIDPELLRSSYARLNHQVLQIQTFDKSPRKFDAIICYAVLELLEQWEQRETIQLFADCMDHDSRLFLLHTNWHPLNARTLVFFLRSLLDREVIGSAQKCHSKYRFARNYGSYAALLSLIEKSGLEIKEVIKGPYLNKDFYVKYCDWINSLFPLSWVDHNVLVIRKTQPTVSGVRDQASV